MAFIKKLYSEFLSTLNELLGRDNKPKKAINSTRLAIMDKSKGFTHPLEVSICTESRSALYMSEPDAIAVSHVGGVLTFIRTKDVPCTLSVHFPQALTHIDVCGKIVGNLYGLATETSDTSLIVVSRDKAKLTVMPNHANSVQQITY